jgi:hypothetical protein
MERGAAATHSGSATEAAATHAGAASAEMGTATSAARMGATAQRRTVLSKARARQRKNQRHGRSGAQNFQTVHDQTPFPAKPTL